MLHGARLELSADAIWVNNATDVGYDGTDAQSVQERNNYYRGKWHLNNLQLNHGSGVYVSGGDVLGYKETVPEFKLHRVHIMDEDSFISADGGGWSAGLEAFPDRQYNYTQNDREINFNDSSDNAYHHGFNGLWFGEGGVHAGSGGTIIGNEFRASSESSGYSSQFDAYGTEGTSDAAHLGGTRYAWKHGRSKKSGGVSIQDCENSNPGTCSRRIIRSRGNAVKPLSWGGSGGSAGTCKGGNGGGSIRITADIIIENHGIITANGGDCQGDMGHGGGGAGGSIWLTIKTGGLFGSGTLRAEGGSGCWQGGGAGSGGRVAVHAMEPPACTWDGDIYVGSGNQTQYRSGDTIVGGLSELDSIPYPRYPAGGTIFLADQNGHNGSLVVTNNGAGGADIAVWADRVENRNYTKVALGSLLLHDTGVHGYHHPREGLMSEDGSIVLEIGTLSTLAKASVGQSHTAGIDPAPYMDDYATHGDSTAWTYTQQSQVLFQGKCVSSTCDECKATPRASVNGFSSPQSLFERIRTKTHITSSATGGDGSFEQGTLYVTNSSVVVLTSQLHVENFAVSVVNSTLFLQNSVTVAANGTFEVSPYTALADDNGTTIPQHSRGCVNALPNATVLSNISNYLTDSIYDFQSDLRGPRGVDGNKEYSFEFYVRMELNETSTDYFESFFGDITDEIYTGTARDGVATPAPPLGISSMPFLIRHV